LVLTTRSQTHTGSGRGNQSSSEWGARNILRDGPIDESLGGCGCRQGGKKGCKKVPNITGQAQKQVPSEKENGGEVKPQIILPVGSSEERRGTNTGAGMGGGEKKENRRGGNGIKEDLPLIALCKTKKSLRDKKKWGAFRAKVGKKTKAKRGWREGAALKGALGAS